MSRSWLFERSWLLLLLWFNASHRFDKPFISFIHIDRLELLWPLASLMCITGWHYFRGISDGFAIVQCHRHQRIGALQA